MQLAVCPTRAAAPVRTARVEAQQRRSARRLIPAASKGAQGYESDGDGTNVNAYCSLDEDGRRPLKQMSLGEKEAAYLDALSSYYYEQQPTLTDEEFDLLKDELVWSGSKVAVLSTDEQRFLEAQVAFAKGRPIMSDADFEALKLELRRAGSPVTAQGARCSLLSRKMYSDAAVDYLKLVAINVPAALLVLGGLFSIDDLTGFEITRLVELPEPYGIIAVWGVVLPTIYVLASSLTNLLFPDALILTAPCPACGHSNSSYFGSILTIPGNRDANAVECGGCKAKLQFDARTREVELIEEAKPPTKTSAKAAAKA